MRLLIAIFVIATGCDYCKDPANANTARCQIQASTIDCAKSAGIATGQKLAGDIFQIIVSGEAANYMDNLAALATRIGAGGVEFVVCEAKAIGAYFDSLKATPSDSIKAKTVLVANRVSDVLHHFAQGKTLIHVEKMPVVVH